MTDVETVRLYLELLQCCKKADWIVETSDRVDRFELSSNDKRVTGLYSGSLYECIGYVTGFLGGIKHATKLINESLLN